MKTYKDSNIGLWAYEEDGSQDHLIPADFILITEEEADAIRAEKIAEYNRLHPIVQPTLAELQAKLSAIQEQINKLGM